DSREQEDRPVAGLRKPRPRHPLRGRETAVEAARPRRGHGGRAQGAGPTPLELEVVARGQVSARYSCARRTTMEPSPTADATRFIGPERTSPAANPPGTLVSRGSGSRCSFQVFA